MTHYEMVHIVDTRDTQQAFMQGLTALGLDAFGQFDQSLFEASSLYTQHPEVGDILHNSIQNDASLNAPLDDNRALVIIRPWTQAEPNFEYPLAGLAIRWNNAPLQEAMSNKRLSKEFIDMMFKDITETLIDQAQQLAVLR